MKRELLAVIACGAGVAVASESTTVTVVVPWISATSDQIEESISLPMMRRLKELPGIEQVRTESSPGAAKIEVAFAGVPKCQDVEAAALAIEDARSSLPSGAGVPVVTQKGAKCKK